MGRESVRERVCVLERVCECGREIECGRERLSERVCERVSV